MRYLGYLIVVALISILVLTTSQGTAGHCPTPVTVIKRPSSVITHHNTAVIKEKEIVTVPIIVPTTILAPSTVFQYLPAFQPIINAPVYNPAVTAPVPAATTPPAPQNLEAQIDKIVKDRLNVILKEPDTRNSLPPPILDDDPKPTTPPNASATEWVNILGKNCYSCHGGTARQGGISLFDTQGRFLPNVSNQQIMDSIRSGSMPKDRPALNATEKAILEQWYNQNQQNPRQGG